MLLLIIFSNSFYYTFANEGQYLTEELNTFENYESTYEQNNQENWGGWISIFESEDHDQRGP